MKIIHYIEIIVGVIGCMIWPFIFSGVLATETGWYGITIGLFALSVIHIAIYKNHINKVRILGRGSWILALLCAFPIIPLYLGGYVLAFANFLTNNEGTMNLDGAVCFIATIIYGGIISSCSYGLGELIQFLTAKNWANQSLHQSP